MDDTNQQDWEASKEHAEKAGKMAADLRKYSLVRYAALAVLILTLPVAVIMAQRQTHGIQTIAATDKTLVYFVPNYVQIPPEKRIKIILDSNAVKVSGVRMEIVFDRALINMTGEVLTTPRLKTVKMKTDVGEANLMGRLIVDLELSPMDKQSPPEGLIELADIFFVPVTDQAGLETKVELTLGALEVTDMSGNKLPVSVQAADVVLNLAQQEDTVLGASVEPEEVSEYVSTRINTDIDGDGCVGFADLKVLGGLFGKQVVPGTLGDINGDGEVKLEDVGIWVDSYGYGCE